MSHLSAITENGARLDVTLYVFWRGRFEKVFVHVRVFNPSTQSNHGSFSTVYHKHEQEEGRKYDQQEWDVEHATSTPLEL